MSTMSAKRESKKLFTWEEARLETASISYVLSYRVTSSRVLGSQDELETAFYYRK